MTALDSPAVGVQAAPPTAGAPTVLGLDLSLTSTGIAGDVGTSTIRSRATGYERLREIRERVCAVANLIRADLVVIEGPSYGSKGGHEHERGGLWWMVTEALDSDGFPLAVVAPTALKKYATGKGNAGKDDMIVATCRRFPDFNGGNDEADAQWLQAMGCDHLGYPMVAMPNTTHRAALDKVRWPEPVTR